MTPGAKRRWRLRPSVPADERERYVEQVVPLIFGGNYLMGFVLVLAT